MTASALPLPQRPDAHSEQRPEQRLEFAPPKAGGGLPSALLALLAHLLLVAALTWGVQWKHQTDSPVIDAELWSAAAIQAAPKAVAPPEPVPPAPVVQPQPAPLPKPLAAPPAPTPEVKDAEIALAREKLLEKKRRDERERALEQERARAETLAREKLAKEKLAQEKLTQDTLAQEKLAREKRDKLALEKKLAEQDKASKREAAQRLAAERQAQAAKAEKAEKAKEAAAQAEAEAGRLEQLNRVKGLAGASGNANATGTALKSSGPSANYAGRIAASVKRNIVFPDDIAGNPVTEVEVRTAPDGTVIGVPRLIKSSGVKAWDEAVIKAIIKTERLPRDEDGRVPPVIRMDFKPKD